jgi:uncharacterized protein YoxC
MTEISLEFISRQLDRVLDEMRTMRRDLDMLTRITLRLDSTVDALREDVKSLWLSQGDLRRRVEALEEKGGRA